MSHKSNGAYLIVVAFAMTLVLSGCLPAGSESSSSELCGAVSQTISPAKIQGGHHLYFNSQDFEILSKPSFELNSITLIVDASSSQLKSSSEIEIGINGIIASRSDGSKKFDDDGSDSSHRHVNMEKLRWNGGEPIASAFAKIKAKKGQIKVSVQGSDVHVTSGYVLLKGRDRSLCPLATATPTPSPSATPVPTPAPIAPSVSIDSVSPSAKLVNQSSIRFGLSSDQANVTYICSIDGGVESPCSSTVVYSELSSASHSFKVYSRSSAGLVSAVANYSWTVDMVPPVVDIVAIASPSKEMSASIQFSSTSAVGFNCSLDNAPMAPCISPYAAFVLAEGTHSFQVTADDAAGNLSVPARMDWVVDVTPPSVQIVGQDPIANPSSSSSRNLSFVANESSYYECSIDGASFGPCGSPHAVSNLNEGLHSFEVRATDVAGNISTNASASWATDLTPPQISLGTVMPAAGRSNADGYHVEFSSNEASTFKCKLDGGLEAACSSPLDGKFVSDGSHSVEVVATDLAGLSSASQMVLWDIDRSAPEISFGLIDPSSSMISTSNISIQVVSAATVTLHASLNGVDLGVVSSPININNLGEQSYDLLVYGEDEYGNRTSIISHSFTVDLTAPTIGVVGQYSAGQITNSTRNEFVLSSSEQVVFYCELDDVGFSECLSPASVAGLIDGNHTFKVYGKDSSGLISGTSEVNWVVDTTAPQTTIAASQIKTNAISVSFSSNEVGSSYVCSVDGGATYSCASPMALTFTPGAHNITVYAVDLAQNKDPDGASYGINIRPPVATSLAGNSLIYTSTTSMSFSFTSNHSDATFVCSLDGAAASPCMSPVSYSNLTDAAHTFVVKAVDSFGTIDSVGATHNWTVDTKSPVFVSRSSSSTSSSITVTWTMNEPVVGKLNWGPGADTSRVTAETQNAAASQSITLVGLSPNTIYSIVISGRDRAGNTYIISVFQIRTRS